MCACQYYKAQALQPRWRDAAYVRSHSGWPPALIAAMEALLGLDLQLPPSAASDIGASSGSSFLCDDSVVDTVVG